MKRQQAILICLAGGLSFLPPVCYALSGDNPYKSIVDRNAFDLAPPPPPPDASVTNPPSNIKLTGIVNIFDKKQAVLLVQEPGPGKPQDSYILGEGERQDQVEVMTIDEAAGNVKVNNAGVVQTLTFDKDGISPDSGGAPPPHGMPSVGGGFANPRVGVRMIPPPPARNFRLPQAQPQQQAQPQAQPFQQSQAIINPFQANQQNQVQNQGQNEAISPEVQQILIEKTRQEHATEIQQGTYPPLPPTSLTPTEDSDSSGPPPVP